MSSRPTSTSWSKLLESAGDKRVVMLVHGDPLFYGLARYPVRPARQGSLRGRAARQQHAARVRPREGELGRGVPHEPRHPSARRGARKDSHGGEGRPVHERSDAARPTWPRRCSTRKIDYFTAYVCENLGSPRRARHARQARPRSPRRSSIALNVMILVREAERARPAARCGRPAAVRQSGRSVPAIEAASGACSRRPKSARWRWRSWTSARRAPSGTSAPAAARWASKRPRWRPTAGLCDRNGPRRARPHPRERRALRRGERERGARPRARKPWKNCPIPTPCSSAAPAAK